jgi:hypothetical protein
MKTRFPSIRLISVVLLALILSACETIEPYDYTAFKQSRPKSILVLPPLNESPEVNATPGMLAQATLPLAESGYYVFPVSLVNETFRQNGMTMAGDIHQVPYAKLYEIFGADSALYINVKEYGTSYKVLASETRVSAQGKLIDLRTGATLWEGEAVATGGSSGNSGGGLIGMLLNAVITQVVDTAMDRSYDIAGMANARLLSAGQPNGILYGPRSPLYMKDGSPQP